MFSISCRRCATSPYTDGFQLIILSRMFSPQTPCLSTAPWPGASRPSRQCNSEACSAPHLPYAVVLGPELVQGPPLALQVGLGRLEVPVCGAPGLLPLVPLAPELIRRAPGLQQPHPRHSKGELAKQQQEKQQQQQRVIRLAPPPTPLQPSLAPSEALTHGSELIGALRELGLQGASVPHGGLGLPSSPGCILRLPVDLDLHSGHLPRVPPLSAIQQRENKQWQ